MYMKTSCQDYCFSKKKQHPVSSRCQNCGFADAARKKDGMTNEKSLNGFLMSPKALRRRGGLSALADSKHAVAAPLPYRGAACVTRELGS